MLVFPELFVPKSPVRGANRIFSIFFHDLKLVALSSVTGKGLDELVPWFAARSPKA